MFLEEMSCRHYDKKECKEQQEHHSYKTGTWNVRTLNQGSKLENLKTEMQKNEASVLCVSEMRWKGQGEIKSGDYTVYYWGSEQVERGVAVVKSVVKKIVCNDRIIALKLKAEPVRFLVMKVYMPTSECEDDEVENLYDTIKEILEEGGKGDTNNIILGDWNSVVGDESYRNIVGSHGLGRRNHRGQILIDVCEKKWTDCHQHMVQEPNKKTVHMEGTWRLESTSVGLYPCEVPIQKLCEGCADTVWGRY